MNLPLKACFASLFGLLTLLAAVPYCRADTPPGTIHDGDRIVFVGDSITGQGGNGAQGWTHLMADALAVSHPAAAPTLIALGGSGQTVGSWQNVEKQSREKAVILDVKGVDVKETLDKHADVVVIMLGMNDVLSPSLSADEDSFDKWAGQYRALVTSLRERTTPRLFAFATVPLCTEDENSPKNKALAAMAQRINAIAKEEKGIVLPVHQTMLDVLAHGRTLHPDFHVTGDFVHPNPFGHLAIAEGMLTGLGEPFAVKSLDDSFGAKLWASATPKTPSVSYAVDYLPATLDSDAQSCKIRYWYLPAPNAALPKVSLAAPTGWKVTPATLTAPSGEFTVTGPFDRWQNALALEATVGADKLTAPITLPAPWLIGTGNLRQITWGAGNSKFDPEKARLPIDDAFLRGESWGKAAELTPGHPVKWLRHYPTVNYLGGPSAGSVDMAAVTFFNSFEVGYGARWINSDRDRTVQFKLGSASFGGNDYLAVFMNGESIYAGSIMADRGKVVEAKLQKGWNALIFKSNHLQWQWHFSIDLVPTPADDLADLRVSTVPHATPFIATAPTAPPAG